jgi:membrane associated rhomboid family serine protease
MPRSAPTTLALPPFSGATRRLILANVAAFFGFAVLGWVSPGIAGLLEGHLMLEPYAVVHGEVWQLVTYSFVYPFASGAILSTVFTLLTLWFTGALLEGAYGSRRVYELYFSSVIGGAVVASAVSFTHLFGMNPKVAGIGPNGGVFGLLVAIGMLFGDQEFFLWFLVRIKAKYLVAIYILIDVAVLLKDKEVFSVLLQLSAALSAYLFVKFAPTRGLAFGLSEQVFGLRNGYYRWKRRRAARKFEVYMGKQGRKVSFDKDGRYIDPDEARKDPNDRKWMN